MKKKKPTDKKRKDIKPPDSLPAIKEDDYLGKIPSGLPLGELAKRINRTDEASYSHLRTGLAYALRCGEYLILAKAKLRFGEWYPWLEKNTSISQKTAEGRMRAARNKPFLEHITAANPKLVSDLTYVGFNKMIAVKEADKKRHKVAEITLGKLKKLTSEYLAAEEHAKQKRKDEYEAVEKAGLSDEEELRRHIEIDIRYKELAREEEETETGEEETERYAADLKVQKRERLDSAWEEQSEKEKTEWLERKLEEEAWGFTADWTEEDQAKFDVDEDEDEEEEVDHLHVNGEPLGGEEDTPVKSRKKKAKKIRIKKKKKKKRSKGFQDN